MKSKFLILRTHGGLGNQLFQLLYARLLAQRAGLDIREVHDQRYRHAFPRNDAVKAYGDPTTWQKTISVLRVPKILGRAIGRPELPWKLGRSVFVDGYFQERSSYDSFDARNIRAQLNILANELGVGPAKGGHLVHLRLGDFFGNKEAAKRHVKSRIGEIPLGSRIMTNDEALLQEPEIANELASKNVNLVPTTGLSAEKVLQEMARHSSIDANDSTLAFWAAVLSRGDLKLSDKRLQQTFQLFHECIFEKAT